jgi:L-ribulose-5-phosphate 3-epimerase UlaE
MKNICPPPYGLLIGIYLFYENWSTETFRNFQKGIVKEVGWLQHLQVNIGSHIQELKIAG